MSQVAERPDVQTLDNFIGGRWVKAHATEFFDVHNPAVGDVIGRTPLSTSADVDRAVLAGHHADHAMGHPAVRAHLPSSPRRGSALPGDARVARAGTSISAI